MDKISLVAVAFSLAIGIVFWYIYYGAECFLNGCMDSSKFMPFKCAWEEFTWLLPGGRVRKLKRCNGNQDWVDMMPGCWAFVARCIAFPLSPLIAYLFLVWRSS